MDLQEEEKQETGEDYTAILQKYQIEAVIKTPATKEVPQKIPIERPRVDEPIAPVPELPIQEYPRYDHPVPAPSFEPPTT